MTAIKHNSLFKYMPLMENNDERRFNICYIFLLFTSIILLVLCGFIIYFSVFFPINVVMPYNVSAPLSTKHYEATVYSLFTSLFNEKPTHFDMPDLDKDKPVEDKVISCYYNAPKNFSDPTQLQPSDIHPHLCTHINVAFAKIMNKTIYIDENLKKAVREVVNLKTQNPDLKVLLSIGGANEIGGFSDMVVNHASRKIFIKSIKAFLQEYKADGVDLDWEFPVIKDGIKYEAHPRERQHFSQLLREIRVEYQREKRNYYLTVAAAAPQVIVDNAYDVDQLDLYTDYVNIMTYDFHFYSKVTPFTGLNSPLYPQKNESLYLATLNINSTVNMYISKGLNPNKIVVGVPTYGHTFSLVNSNNPHIGSPCSGYGKLGSLGFVNYPEICKFIQKYNNEVTIVKVTDAKVSYLYRGHEWVSFENRESVMEKAEYIKHYGLRGAMIYALNSDDYLGDCQIQGNSKFPLSHSIKSTLVNVDVMNEINTSS